MRRLLIPLMLSASTAGAQPIETATIATATTAPAPIAAAPVELAPPLDLALPVEVAATSTPTEDAPAVVFEVAVRSGRAARTPGSAHVIGPAALERFEHDDPHQVVAQVPGVYSRGEDGVGLRPNIGIRGVNPDRSKKLTLMEDGILFAPAPYSAPAAYYFPIITRMTQVRVLKGPASISYGPHTVGGAIDLVTRPAPTETRAAIDAAGGLYGYGKAHAWAGSQGEDLAFVIEGVHLREDGFKTLLDDADTGFYRNEWMGKLAYKHDGPGDSHGELRLKLGYSDERSNETYLGLADDDFARDPLARYAISALDRMSWSRTSGVVTHVWRASPDFSLTTNVYRHDLSRTWRKVNGFRGASLFDVLTRPDDPQSAVYREIIAGRAETNSSDEVLLVGPNQREFVSQGAELRARWDETTGPLSHKIEGGLRLHYDRVERRHSEDGFRVTGSALIPEGSATVVTAFNEASTLAGALHLTDAVTWGDLTVTPGLRVELLNTSYVEKTSGAESVRNHVVVLPGVGAYYAIVPELGVLAGVHRGFSPPAPALGGDPQPELSVAYETGVRASWAGLRAEVIGYYNDYSNLTDVCTLSSGCTDVGLDQQFDAGEANIYGIEAHLAHDVELPADLRIPVIAAYTFTRAEFETDFESDDPIYGRVKAGDEVPYVPQHQGHLTVGLEHPRAGLALTANYVSRMREIAGSVPFDQTLATDALFVLDLAAKVVLHESISLYANLRNVLDEQVVVSRRPFGARPNAPRWLQVGLKASF